MEDKKIKVLAIKVKQPLGEFFIASFSVSDLLKITESHTLNYRVEGDKLVLSGSQRKIKENKLKELGKYIDSEEAAFPNSIVLAANYNKEGKVEDSKSWTIKKLDIDNLYELEIPKGEKSALIIDGQHRLRGFQLASNYNRIEDVQLPCSIYIDLPSAYQAYIFATINYNQTKVDKSLAYEMYGFDTESISKESWSPDILAVFLSRVLNFNEDSPLYHHITIVPEHDIINEDDSIKKWTISTATFVEGIMSLITTNNNRDRDEIHKYSLSNRKRSVLAVFKNDHSPLRGYYIQGKDHIIQKVIENYFIAFKEMIPFNESSFLFKTIGIQALFDILKKVLKEWLNEDKDISVEYFSHIFEKINNIDFSKSIFKKPSGAGRTFIRNVIEVKLELKQFEDIKVNDQVQKNDYREALEIESPESN